MAADGKITIDERRKYLKRADGAKRSTLLSEMELVTGLHRKSLLHLLHAPSLDRQPRAP